MYALTACRTGRLDEAWDLFLRTASIDITGGGKQWAGEIYIGGTHPASNGGAWMIAALGFAGLRIRNGKPELHPRLPYFNLIGWDFGIDQQGEPVLIEWNRAPDLSQTAHGPAFGEMTEEILLSLRHKPNTVLNNL